jgi:uridine kinase
MIGDRIKISESHTIAATQIVDILRPRIKRKYVIAIAGESGAGKSEIAMEMKRAFHEKYSLPVFILQQDDYFVLPPRTNAEKRKEMITWVGTREVQLSMMDDHLRKFREGVSLVHKPIISFEEDRIDEEEIDFSLYKVLIAEGTYTSLLRHADARIFIDRDYNDTREYRASRGREVQDPFLEEVLAVEHRIICTHGEKADLIVNKDFSVREIPRTK